MGSRQFEHSMEEGNRTLSALQIFFKYLDQRGPIILSPPPEIQQAFNVIVEYYTLRLKNVVCRFPSDFLTGAYEPGDAYQHAWLMLWWHGHRIKNRSVAGVFSWLKRVIINYKLNCKRKEERCKPLELLLGTRSQLRFGQVKNFMQRLHLIPEACWEDEDEIDFRWQLLQELFAEALLKLNDRQRKIIKLDRERYSLHEIARKMGFRSRNAVSLFKRRAFKAVKKHLYVLCLRELDDPQGDLHRKNVIEEWLERYHVTQREKKRNE